MKYTTLLFDSDNTLLDFSLSEQNALKQAMSELDLTYCSDYGKIYAAINDEFWKAFEKGEIEKKDIYVGRFKRFLGVCGVTADAVQLAHTYERCLSQQFYMLDGAYELIKNLAKSYSIYIVTNGNRDIQYSRLKGSGLLDIVDGVFVSEVVGYPKPDKRYFDYVFQNITEKDKSKILIIGDSQSSDILGGINAGVDTCWYNRSDDQAEYISTYRIKSISDIYNVL